MKYPNAYACKVKLTEDAKKISAWSGINFLPERAHPTDAGLDLKACIAEGIGILPGQTVKIPTGVHIWLGDINEEEIDLDSDETFLPMQLAGLYLPRSSNKGLVLENTVGLLDESYQGESFIKFKNVTSEAIYIWPGNRIAQLVIIPSLFINFNLVESFDEQTTRAEGGDGSTGGTYATNN